MAAEASLGFVIVFAMTAGALSLISPCGYVLLPGYIAYLLGEERKVRSALLSGAAAVMGLLKIYILMGVLTGLAGSIVLEYLPSFTYVAAAIVITLGAAMLLNINIPAVGLSSNLATRFNLSGIFGFYVFGIGYGLGAQACTFPIFITIVLFALALGNPAAGVIIFLAYTVGVAAPLIATTILVSLAKTAVLNKIKYLSTKLHRISGVLLIIVGIYLILLGMGIIYIYGTDVIFMPGK